MSQRRVSGFFALVQEKRHSVVRAIKTERDLQADLAEMFEEQAAEFLPADVERIPFSPHFKVEDDRVFEIEGYPLPADIEKAAKSPDGVEPFTLSKLEPSGLKAVFATSYDRSDNSIRALFQKSSSSRMLKAGWSLFVRDGTFRKLSEPGLTLESSLVAVYEAGSLLFRKFSAVNPLLEIKGYFVQATDEEAKELFGHRLFVSADAESLCLLCDMPMRRRLAFIKTSGILDKVTAQKVQSGVKSYFEDINITYITKTSPAKLVLPTKKKELKRVLVYLCEGYYRGELTEERFETNSHRKIR